MRACLVQGSQQIWVAALWYWGYELNTASSGNMGPWWIVLIVWPLSVISFVFAYLMLYGLPGVFSSSLHSGHLAYQYHLDYYRQSPPKVPHFLRTLFRRKIVLWSVSDRTTAEWIGTQCCLGSSDLKSCATTG